MITQTKIQCIGRSQPVAPLVDQEDPLDSIARWECHPRFKVFTLQLELWSALEAHGFRDIRIRQESYESAHGLWRFTVSLDRVPPTSKSVIQRIREACESIGHPVGKEFVAAVVGRGRARGGFILENRKMKKGKEL
jgi:hypothetical protein